MIEFVVSAVIPASPEVVYAAWLDSDGHSKMTGAKAEVSAFVGGVFQAWDGYIQGKNLELEAGKRILQAWRTIEFEASDPDSIVEISFQPAAEGTDVVLRHTNLPPHGTQYEQGWIDSYFSPMHSYFTALKGKNQPGHAKS
jgi:uncharacterized protein YndB with AHSA1/START domain